MERISQLLKGHVQDELSELDVIGEMTQEDYDRLIERLVEKITPLALEKVAKEDLASALADRFIDEDLLDDEKIEERVADLLFEKATFSIRKE